MTVRKTPLLIGEYYHIYNRGVDKRVIFLDEHDHKRFMMLLYLCNGTNPVDMRKYFDKNNNNKGQPFVDFVEIFSIDRGEQIVDIGAYCLMPNHFHILVHERVEGGISMFMEKLSTAYSMYFNRKYERKGSLFEGRFKAKHIDSNPYLNWLFSYIHLNPIKLIYPEWKEKGIKDSSQAEKFMYGYEYSSYHDYFVGDRPEETILNKNVFPEHFSELNDFQQLIEELDEGENK